MKSGFVTVLASFIGLSGSAFADGFVCETLDGSLTVKVYNETEPSLGTRNAAVMILSDNTVSEGRKTIATFPSDNDLIENSSATYIAHVDLRYTESGRGGENVLGTKLAKVGDILLDVDFDYSRPVASSAQVEAKLILIKRNAEKIKADLICSRYLKN